MAILLKRIWNYYRIKSAIKTANERALLQKKQFFVIKIFKKIKVYDRAKIDYLIREKILHPKLKKIEEIQKIAIYYTR